MISDKWKNPHSGWSFDARLFIEMCIRKRFRLVLALVVITQLGACQTTSVPMSEVDFEEADSGSTVQQATTSNTKPGNVSADQYSTGSQGASYRIGPEDVLMISVWKEDELQREVLVRPDGGISFPLAGDVAVAGKTTQQVELEITRKIRRYIPDAVVTVSVKTISGYTIYVNGKVNNPGKFTLGRYVDVVQALTLAGGLSPFAKEGSILVQRRDPRGRIIVFPFNYKEIRKGKNLQQNIILQSGDVIVVP